MKLIKINPKTGEDFHKIFIADIFEVSSYWSEKDLGGLYAILSPESRRLNRKQELSLSIDGDSLKNLNLKPRDNFILLLVKQKDLTQGKYQDLIKRFQEVFI